MVFGASKEMREKKCICIFNYIKGSRSFCSRFSLEFEFCESITLGVSILANLKKNTHKIKTNPKDQKPIYYENVKFCNQNYLFNL